MGTSVHNVEAYYHGNNGERGLLFSYHLPFDQKTTQELRRFVKRDDVVGFIQWLRRNHPLAYSMCEKGGCPEGTFHTLKESRILDIQTKRIPRIQVGPEFPADWKKKSLALLKKLQVK